MGYCCFDCAYLDKSYKQKSGKHYIYGCKWTNGKVKRQTIVGWLSSDGELKTMGGSCWKSKEELKQEIKPIQMDMFSIIATEEEPFEPLSCDGCLYDVKGCCAYDTKDEYCVLGDKRRPKC